MKILSKGTKYGAKQTCESTGVRYRGRMPQISEEIVNYLELDIRNKEKDTADSFVLLYKIGSEYIKYKCQIYKKRKKYRTPGKYIF